MLLQYNYMLKNFSLSQFLTKTWIPSLGFGLLLSRPTFHVYFLEQCRSSLLLISHQMTFQFIAKLSHQKSNKSATTFFLFDKFIMRFKIGILLVKVHPPIWMQSMCSHLTFPFFFNQFQQSPPWLKKKFITTATKHCLHQQS